MRRLDIWMNGERVGQWEYNATGTAVLRYAESWLRSDHVRALSLSLPLLPGNEPHRGRAVSAWFDNLLPDSRAIRERLASRFRTRSTHAFDLLGAIGRDCVGAVQLLTDGAPAPDVRRIESTPVDDAQVAALLRGVTADRVFGLPHATTDFRISIAGAQEKTALLRLGDGWHVPSGATPTTHILKLPLGLVGNMRYDMQHSVENEWLCMQLLGELGLPVAQTEIAHFEDAFGVQTVLVSERFDRAINVGASTASPRWITRLPQEDLCQAFGRSPDEKYEAEGGPGVEQIVDLLRAGEAPERDVLTFATAQLAFWLLAAIDGHAKNFSVFLQRDGYVLTPLYDVLSAWPIIGRGASHIAAQDAALAMAIRGERRPRRQLTRIATRHWALLAERTGVEGAFDHFVHIVRISQDALDRVLQRVPPDFPSHVRDAIERGVLAQRKRFLRGI